MKRTLLIIISLCAAMIASVPQADAQDCLWLNGDRAGKRRLRHIY
ncbi:MAG: hypothetical protein PHP76_02210 [Bacteroidales bacterium]|nr:hypothetical protein [Bacteroidales bacterium]